MTTAELQERGRVLFADDDAFYRDLAAAALADAGYSVTVCSEGASALEQLSTQAFDLAVLDLEMPGMSGFDIIERVRSGANNRHIPILVITGHDDTKSVDRAFHIGATSFLNKPLNWLLFVHHVHFVLKSARSEAETRDASRRAELLSDLQSRLVSLLVTEFQKPLKSAYGLTTLLKMEADGPIASPLYRQYINDVHAAVERLSATHVKMLNFGRALAEGITLNEETVPIASLLAEIARSARAEIERRQIRLDEQFDVPPDLQIRCDRALIGQALRGMMSNGSRFSPRGASLSVQVATTADGDLEISIADSAPAMAQAQIDEILGALSGSRSAAITGDVENANALKVSRVLAEAHQGRLMIRSISGDGNITKMILPRARLASSQPLTRPAPAAPRGPVNDVPMFRSPFARAV
jgi:DNA-binding response OmpR family regulator